MDEYLEGLFERSYDREAGQEERVFNSLSFFVAAMALTINALGYIATKLPPFAFSAYSLTTYALMGLAAALMAPVIWALFDGVRERIYRLPPKETDTLAWAFALKNFHIAKGLSGKALDNAVVGELREEMLREFAESVVHNRAQNAKRTGARTTGIILMVGQLALAFFIVAIIFVHDRFAPDPSKASAPHDHPPVAASPQTVTHGVAGVPKAGPAAPAVPCRRVQDSRC